MKPTGDIDHDFVMMIRHHHQMALQMARHQIKNGKDPKVRSWRRRLPIGSGRKSSSSISG
jgi:uncharacterized protein (DUF305 family)